MQVAQDWAKLPTAGNLSLRDALRLLSSETEEESEPEPTLWNEGSEPLSDSVDDDEPASLDWID